MATHTSILAPVFLENPMDRGAWRATVCLCARMLSRFSHVRLSTTPWTVARQAPLSMGFSRQEYWSGLPCPPPGDLLDSGIKPMSPAAPALQADCLPLSHQGSPGYSLWGCKESHMTEATEQQQQP